MITKLEHLDFSYQDVDKHICYTCKNGQWDKGELISSPYLPIHIASTSLHYGQTAFEGLKAFRSRDGKINVFRPQENIKRLQKSCERILMPLVPSSIFLEAVKKVILANERFIPPYGNGNSLYIRPLVIGTSPRIGIEPSSEYKFIVLVVPVGSYYKKGLSAVDATIIDGYDRSATHGIGNVKVGGNYAASLKPSKIAKEKGFPITLYLDSSENKFIDEFTTSNFIAIKDNIYITPDSPSILTSITNLSLMEIAHDMNMTIEKRKITLDEIETFDQIAACGTAVVITPINKIYHKDKVYSTGNENVHSILKKLYQTVLDIQHGDKLDKYKWNWQI